MKNKRILWINVSVVTLLAVIWLLPTSRYWVIGLLTNEPWAEARAISYDGELVVESAHSQRRPIRFWIAQLRDQDAPRREQAARALGGLGPRGKAAVPGLLRVIQDEQLRVRITAVEALGRIGPDAKEAVPELMKFYQDRNENIGIREAAVAALGEMGFAAQDAVPVMIKMLAEDEAFALSGHIQMAVTRMGPAAVPELIELLQDPDAKVRAHAAVALQWISPGAKGARSALVTALQDEHLDVEIRRLLMVALARQEADVDAATALGSQ